jgi:hypothetical protein
MFVVVKKYGYIYFSTNLSLCDLQKYDSSEKESPKYWVSIVKLNRILYEINGVPEIVVKAAMRIELHTKCLSVFILLLLYPIKI